MAVSLQTNEVEDTIKRVMSHDRVARYVIFNKDGIVLKYDGWESSADQGYKECVQIAATIAPLVQHCQQGCHDLLLPPNNDVECIRLKTKSYEMIVAPGKNYTMVAFQEEKASDENASDQANEQ